MQIIECNFHMHYDQKQYTEDKLSQTTLFIWEIYSQWKLLPKNMIKSEQKRISTAPQYWHCNSYGAVMFYCPLRFSTWQKFSHTIDLQCDSNWPNAHCCKTDGQSFPQCPFKKQHLVCHVHPFWLCCFKVLSWYAFSFFLSPPPPPPTL